LILDPIPYSEEATIVYLGILVQSRVLPLAWSVMPQKETWEQGQWEIVGHLFELCQRVGWHYVLRIKQEQWCRRRFGQSYRQWQQGKQFVSKPGQHWYGEVLLWQEHQFARLPQRLLGAWI
jgi:hypothetical protein